MMNKHLKIIKNMDGQALLFVVIAMSIALTIGVSLSARTLSSLKRTASTDTSSRVLSAAEGGIEWFLVQPVDILNKLSDSDKTNNGTDCPNGTTYSEQHPDGCVITYEPVSTDDIATRAIVSIERFVFNFIDGVNDHYWFDLDPGNVKQIFTKDYTNGNYYTGNIEVCWKSKSETQAAAIYYTAFDSNGILVKHLVEPSATAARGSINVDGSIVADVGKAGTDYTSCFEIDAGSISNSLEGIRFKALYAPAKVGVFADINFPIQGYKITSLGEINNVKENVKTVKEITVYKSLPYMPATFDYAIYSNNSIN